MFIALGIIATIDVMLLAPSDFSQKIKRIVLTAIDPSSAFDCSDRRLVRNKQGNTYLIIDHQLRLLRDEVIAESYGCTLRKAVELSDPEWAAMSKILGKPLKEREQESSSAKKIQCLRAFREMTVPAVGPCDAPLQSPRENLLARLKIYPNLKPENYDGGHVQIREEDKEKPTFFRVTTSTNKLQGDTYGGFKYEIKDIMCAEHTYRLSFCAWSINARGLGLRIQHETGNGEEGSLTRTALITNDHSRFAWTGRLDKLEYNIVQRYFFGYLYDIEHDKPYDNFKPGRFEGKEFVIGDFRLEQLDDEPCQGDLSF